MSIKNHQSFKFKIKKSPDPTTTSTAQFNNGNLSFEILKMMRNIASSQNDFQSYVTSEIMLIHDKLDQIVEKFNRIELEAENEELIEETTMLEMEDSQDKQIKNEEHLQNEQILYSEDNENNSELEEPQSSEFGMEEQYDESRHQPVYLEIDNQDRDLHDINPDNMISLLYQPNSKQKLDNQTKTVIALDREEEYQFEQIELLQEEVEPAVKRPRSKPISEKYIPKIEKKSSDENPYSSASTNELLNMPIRCLDHLEAIENILQTDSPETQQFRAELIARLQHFTPQIRNPNNVVDEISKSCFRQIVIDDVMQYFCWLNKFPKQYPFLNEMRKYLFFADVIYTAWEKVFPSRADFELSMKKVIRGTRIRFHLNRRRSNARQNKSLTKKEDTSTEYMEFAET